MKQGLSDQAIKHPIPMSLRMANQVINHQFA